MYLYQDYLPEGCPPEDYAELENPKRCFRFVFDEINDPSNFKPQYLKEPRRYKPIGKNNPCSGLALSFYNTIQSSNEAFKYLLENVMGKRAYINIGTKIAEGTLSKDDGKSGTMVKSGHFNFHPFETFDYHKFQIVSDL